MKKLLLVIITAFLSITFLGIVQKVEATGYCPNYNGSVYECYCYPTVVNVTVNSCLSNGHYSSVTVTWDGRNCGYYNYNIYNGSTIIQQQTYSPQGTANVTGDFDPAQKIGVSPHGCSSSGCNDGQTTYDPSPVVNCAAPQKKYKCSNNACVEDDANGTFTDSGCNNSCTPAAAPHTKITVAVKLPGIPTADTNGQLKAPNTLARHIHVELFHKDDVITDSSQPVYDIGWDDSRELTYDSNTGYFRVTDLDLGTNIPTGDYQIFIRVPRYLRRQVADSSGNKVFTLTQGQTTTLPQVTLIPGDVASFYNQLDMQDYNALISCYGSTSASVKSSCAIGLSIADLNDDGKVDPIDINIFLIGLRMLMVDQQSQSSNGDGPIGD